MAQQVRIEIARVMRDFCPDPVRLGKLLVGCFKLDFGHHQPGVVAQKFIDFPHHALVRDAIATFFDDRLFAKLAEEFRGIVQWNRIFPFAAR